MKLREDVAVVIVTHNLQQAYRVADYVAFMYLGELVEYGSAQTDVRLARASSGPRSTSAVRSGRRLSSACAAALPSRWLSGCVTTQKIAPRAAGGRRESWRSRPTA